MIVPVSFNLLPAPMEN